MIGVTSQYGSSPKLVTPSAFGGKTYTYYKGDYEDVLYFETDSAGTIISYGALSNNFTSTFYSAGDITSTTVSYLQGTVADSSYTGKAEGIVTYRKDLMTSQRVTDYCVEFMSDEHTYEKYYAMHAVIMLNYFLRKDGYSARGEFSEEIYDTVDKIVSNGKSISTYAEENGKEMYCKKAGTDTGYLCLYEELPNPLRPVSCTRDFVPTEDKKYAYLSYSMFINDSGNYDGSVRSYYFDEKFIEKNDANIELTQEEQTKYEEAKQCYIDSINTFNQNGTDYFETEPNYKKTPLIAGKIKQNKLEGATGFLNSIRVAAGLSKLNYSSDLTKSAQYKATLISYILYKGIKETNPHFPTKPDDVDQSFYDTAQENMAFENLYSGNIITSITNAINDGDGDTVLCGHRYNLLRPGATSIGIGYTDYGQSAHKLSGYASYDTEAVAWPSIGITPTEAYSGGYWTLRFYKNYSTTSDTQVNVKCLNNNKEWNFITKATTGDNRFSTVTDEVSFYNADMSNGASDGYVYVITIKNVKNTSTNNIQDYTYRTVFKNLSDSTKIVYPTSVSLDKTQIQGTKGSKFVLKTTFSDNNPTEIRTIWSSSNSNVATVNQYGEVTIVAEGSATIKVETLNGKTATCLITGKSGINSLKIEQNQYILRVGDSKAINVTEGTGVVIDKSEIIWESSDSSKAKVENGNIKGLAEGEITLKATYAGKSDSCKVKVIPKTSNRPTFRLRSSLGYSELLEPGETTTIAFTQEESSVYFDKMECNLIYDPTYIEIVKIEPVLNGITANKVSNGKIHFSYDITAQNDIFEIKDNLAIITIKAKESAVYAENNFNMNDVTYHYYGKSYEEYGSFQYPITVKTANSIKTITLSKTSMTLSVIGSSSYLRATIDPEENIKDSTITWTSSNEKVAKVDDRGLVLARGEGSAIITAKTVNGKTATCKVTVPTTSPATIAITGITLNKTNLTLNKGANSTLKATINPNNTTQSKTVTWTSSNSSVVTVDSNGKITAKASGTAVITAKTVNGKTAICKVTVPSTSTIPTKPTTPAKAVPSVSYRTHVQNVGWQSYVKNGTMAGTSGRSLRLEGINIKLENNEYGGGISYKTHVQNIGWQNYVQNGAMSGTSGKSLRLEGISIKLTGKIAKYYDVYYRVHCQNFGWLDWAKNGEYAGSAGYSYRLEGIQICLVKKGGTAPGKTEKPFVQRYINYQTHVQNIGWQNKVRDGETSGTSGKSLRLEGIKIQLENPEYDGNIEYRTHVQNIGWQNYVKNGAMSGTSGRSLRLEAIQIRLTGTMAQKYDIYYRVHSQNFGWMGWAKNGASAGTAGYSYRLEAIQICIIEKGKSAPGSTVNCFKSK